MLLWILGCAYKGIPMPGTPRHLSGYVQNIETSNEQSVAEVSSEIDQLPLTVQDTQIGELVAQSAMSMKGKSTLVVQDQTYRFDCSGFVLAVYAQSGQLIEGNTRSLFAQSKSSKTLFKTRPLPGDVVFFDNTYDRNRNRKLDDELTHIGIVTSVSEDDTVAMMHLGGSGVTAITMNLTHPNEHRSPEGVLWNSYLRVNKSGENSPRLAGQLFVSYGRLWSMR